MYQPPASNAITRLTGLSFSGSTAAFTAPAQSIMLLVLPTGTANFVRVATVGANVKTYTDAVSKGTYLYRVQAFNATKAAAYSNTVSVRVVK